MSDDALNRLSSLGRTSPFHLAARYLHLRSLEALLKRAPGLDLGDLIGASGVSVGGVIPAQHGERTLRPKIDALLIEAHNRRAAHNLQLPNTICAAIPSLPIDLATIIAALAAAL